MTGNTNDTDKYSVGDRIVYEDSIGTVKYVGELQSVKGRELEQVMEVYMYIALVLIV